MTRKDYVLIAEAVRASRSQIFTRPSEAMVWGRACDEVAMTLAAELRSTNPLFDRGRFLRACGVEG